MEKRKASWYSIVRYKANDLAGEIINVGIILHSLDGEGNALFKFLLINENSPKIRAISELDSDIQIYKTFKEALEYYLEESSENLFGRVGEIEIASPSQNDFLEKLYDYHRNERLFLTRPSFSLTNNLDALFEALFSNYIGAKYLPKEQSRVSTKKYMRKLLEDRHLLNKKVISDHYITPIEELEDVKIKIDFCYKNGVWNYMQGLPSITGASQKTEWFAKTKFMFENIDKNAQIHLLYNEEDVKNEDVIPLLNYFHDYGSNVNKLNVNDKESMEKLFTQITEEAQDVNELLIS